MFVGVALCTRGLISSSGPHGPHPPPCPHSKFLVEAYYLSWSPLTVYYTVYLLFTLLGNIVSPLFVRREAGCCSRIV